MQIVDVPQGSNKVSKTWVRKCGQRSPKFGVQVIWKAPETSIVHISANGLSHGPAAYLTWSIYWSPGSLGTSLSLTKAQWGCDCLHDTTRVQFLGHVASASAAAYLSHTASSSFSIVVVIYPTIGNLVWTLFDPLSHHDCIMPLEIFGTTEKSWLTRISTRCSLEGFESWHSWADTWFCQKRTDHVMVFTVTALTIGLATLSTDCSCSVAMQSKTQQKQLHLVWPLQWMKNTRAKQNTVAPHRDFEMRSVSPELNRTCSLRSFVLRGVQWLAQNVKKKKKKKKKKTGKAHVCVARDSCVFCATCLRFAHRFYKSKPFHCGTDPLYCTALSAWSGDYPWTTLHTNRTAVTLIRSLVGTSYETELQQWW